MDKKVFATEQSVMNSIMEQISAKFSVMLSDSKARLGLLNLLQLSFRHPFHLIHGQPDRLRYLLVRQNLHGD